MNNLTSGVSFHVSVGPSRQIKRDPHVMCSLLIAPFKKAESLLSTEKVDKHLLGSWDDNIIKICRAMNLAASHMFFLIATSLCSHMNPGSVATCISSYLRISATNQQMFMPYEQI
eukprot:TRINITY_DN2338_c0_g2_i1.p1 TRINITY_DN2338_c0_g2~~TRINITY_DN2338_c0_g2_i1.p1  ORF type:complete len:115 (-),score=14.57 TRINITY_DN2338_c0_g2_i1:114-458(-)